MATPLSVRDLELLGYSAIQQDVDDANPGWTSFKGVAYAGLEQVSSRFIYLKSDCTVEQLAAAARFSTQQGTGHYVIETGSTSVNPERIRRAFTNCKHFTLPNLLWEEMRRRFTPYVSSLVKNLPQEPYFVTPRPVDNPKGDLLDDANKFLIGRSAVPTGSLVVLKAPAGVGKTTLSRQVIRTLAESFGRAVRTVPVFVEASHWNKLRLESVGELSEIIQMSLLAYTNQPPLSAELFDHALRRGHIAFVFDGFDELCGHRSGNFDANEVLSDLATLARESDARIIVTTRTLFWEQAITTVPENVAVWSLASFTRQQAVDYLEKRFSSSKQKRDRARAIYDTLSQGSRRPQSPGGGRAQFVNLPLCVVMVADQVEIGAKSVDLTNGESEIEQFLEVICAREQVRQGLKTDAKAQIQAFENLVSDSQHLREPNPAFEISDLVILGFDSHDLESVRSHWALTSVDGKKYLFKYEFLPPFLRAMFLERQLFSGSRDYRSSMWELMSLEARGQGFLHEHLIELAPRTGWQESISQAIQSVDGRYPEAKSFLLHLVVGLADDRLQIVTRKERTDSVFGLIDTKFRSTRIVNDFTFFGPMSGLDVHGVTFQGCTFVDASFTQSNAGEDTVFRNCTFQGMIEVPKTKDWASVQMENCRLDPPSNIYWEEVLRRTQGSKEQLVVDAISYALRKFWHNGHLRENLRTDDWTKGVLSYTRLRDLILEGLLHFNVVSHEVTSGVSGGVYRFNRSHLPALQRFMDSRQPIGVIRELVAWLLRKLAG